MGYKQDLKGIGKWKEAHPHKGEAGGEVIIDAAYHSAQFGWDEAVQECQAEGKRLCTLAEYCDQDGIPRGGVIKKHGDESGDAWVAVGDQRGEYLQVGNMIPERICKTHSSCCGGLPGNEPPSLWPARVVFNIFHWLFI